MIEHVLTAKQRLQLFHGTWNVQRTIIDQRMSSTLRFEGQALVTSMEFQEHGDMVGNGAKLRSSRTYRLDCEEDAVVLRFANLNEFIRIAGGASQRVRHQCGEDVYRGCLIFRTVDSWAEIWRVTGPRKSYRSMALYQRA